MSLRMLCFVMLLLVCRNANSQLRPIDPNWIRISQPKEWISPPRELHLNEKTGVGEIMVLYPSGEYGYVACYLIRGKNGHLSISRGDGFVVKTGTWERKDTRLLVTSRTVYMTVVVEGKPVPSQPEVESFSDSTAGTIRREKDLAVFRHTSTFTDVGFLGDLIGCDRLYTDGHKPLEGPQPCMPKAAATP